jgi:serine protease Do
MNRTQVVKRSIVGVITGLLMLLLAFLIGGIWVLVRRQAELEDRLRDIKSEYIPMKDVLASKQMHVVERVATTASIWRPVQDRIKDTVVQIVTHAVDFDFLQPFKTPAQGTSYGSGFFITDQGEIVTNAHVIDQATAIWIQIPSLGKRILDAHIVGVSPERDLALLRISSDDLQFIQRELGSVPYLSFGNSDLIRRSDDVMALGYPLGQHALKSTTGVISCECEQHFIQTSAAINPGSSGGPLLNTQGEVIGINSAGVTAAQNVGYAIPVNELKLILPELNKNRLLRKPFLGFVVLNSTEAVVEYLGNPPPGGCYVVEVLRGSIMERAGVRNGDMIYEINGNSVDLFGEMTVPWSEDKLSVVEYVSRLTPGQEVGIIAYRCGERKEFHITFDHAELSAIRRMYPAYEHMGFEVFAGVVVMELTKNHIQLLANQAPGLARYGDMRLQNQSTLLVTHVFPNSYLCRCRNITVGSTINEVNGIPVRTLDELREALKKGLNKKFLTFLTSDNTSRISDNILTVLPWEKIIEEEPKLAQCYHYQLTETSRDLIDIYQAQKTFGAPSIKIS